MSILGKIWDEAVGAYEWLKSLTLGEFAEDRPLSVIVTDMLFAMTVPGAVVVTSMRDLAAVCLRLGRRYEGQSTSDQNATHPEWQEWVILIASAMGVFGPIICAAVGSLVGALIGDEAAAFLRALCLLLVREGEVVLTKVIGFLARFSKGDIVKLLAKLKFADYGTKLVAELQQYIRGVLSSIAKAQKQLSRIEYFERARELLAQLERMEARFYAVQARVAEEIPKALSKLDEQLQRLLKDTLPPVHHQALAGVRAVKTEVAAADEIRVSSGIGEPPRPLLQVKSEGEAGRGAHAPSSSGNGATGHRGEASRGAHAPSSSGNGATGHRGEAGRGAHAPSSSGNGPTGHRGESGFPKDPSQANPTHPNVHRDSDADLYNAAAKIVAIADRRKFADYIFRPGADHGKDVVFTSLGYSIDDSDQLVRIWETQAAQKYANGEFTLGKADQYGQRVNIEIALPGKGAADGQISYLKSGWMVESDGSLKLNTPFSGFMRNR
ncbi:MULTISPECIES: DUF6883 domain-containing protein [unclassified Caballeronia]|uniref:DUF6883 domain-containing protein n=1 Tax=unclassified Caballeronia TaxID=2646786 RepID=UPI00285980A7|nr:MULTISPECIES: DUF6883 domain-containing protein [unclassified Caballeronia]MDR5749864.1 hypothetical protein [Caballeronia sp. LZ024]MDR5843008.1 hypothetical protein [Caballeronia sp. LZ031]